MKTIHKLKKHQDQIPYIMLAREVIQQVKDPSALAIWAYLQSKSDNWQVVEGHIRAHFNLSKQKYMAAMRQLREIGLYKVVRQKTENGVFTGSSFHIYAIPHKLSTSAETHTCGKPEVWKTRGMENDTYIKENEITKEEKSSKEDDIIVASATTPKKQPVKKSGLVAENDFEQKLIDYRKEIGKPLKTRRGLNGLLSAISTTAKAWHVTEEQVFEHLAENEWQSINPTFRNPFEQVNNYANQQPFNSSQNATRHNRGAVRNAILNPTSDWAIGLEEE